MARHAAPTITPQEMQKHAKSRIKALDLNGEGQIRINKSGCLDRCHEGPCVVVYPEGVWYTYVDAHDIDEIVDRHLVKGEDRRAFSHLAKRQATDAGVDRESAGRRSRRRRLRLHSTGLRILTWQTPQGIVYIGHPHPLFGGTLENKVVSTIARSFAGLGWLAVRFNFRGVGALQPVSMTKAVAKPKTSCTWSTRYRRCSTVSSKSPGVTADCCRRLFVRQLCRSKGCTSTFCGQSTAVSTSCTYRCSRRQMADAARS